MCINILCIYINVLYRCCSIVEWRYDDFLRSSMIFWAFFSWIGIFHRLGHYKSNHFMGIMGMTGIPNKMIFGFVNLFNNGIPKAVFFIVKTK